MEIRLFKDDAETLRPVVDSWQLIASENTFGLLANDVDKYLSGLKDLADGDNSDLLVLYDDGSPIGYIGLQYFTSPLSNQKMANEHYFFVIPEKRGLSSMRLIKQAKLLAKQKGCSHFIMNASNLASKLHRKVCKLYERLDMKLFESSYICEI